MTGHVIHEDIIVNAPAETVWAVVTDLQGRPEFLRSVKRAEVLTEGEYGVGTTWQEDRDLFGHHGTEELHVTECEGHHTVQQTQLRHDRITLVWRVSPAREGGSKLMVTLTADMNERRPLEKLAWGLWGELDFQGTRRHVRHDLEDFRTEAERRHADHPGGPDGPDGPSHHHATA